MKAIRKTLRRPRGSGGTGTAILDKLVSKRGSECRGGQAGVWGRKISQVRRQPGPTLGQEGAGGARGAWMEEGQKGKNRGCLCGDSLAVSISRQEKPPECCKHPAARSRLDWMVVRSEAQEPSKPRVWEGRKICSSPWERWGGDT